MSKTMRTEKRRYKRNIRRRRRRQQAIRIAASIFFYALKIIMTALVVLLLMKASAIPEKEAAGKEEAGKQTQEREAAVINKDARQQATQQKSSVQASGPSFVPLDVPMAEEDQKAIFDICNEYKVAFTLVMAMIERESAFDASARSNTGDSGLMQINDSNSARLAELGFNNLYDARENVEAAVYMLRELFDKYGEVEDVLMCYNMGEASAAKLWEKGIHSSEYSSAITAREAEFSAYIDSHTIK